MADDTKPEGTAPAPAAAPAAAPPAAAAHAAKPAAPRPPAAPVPDLAGKTTIAGVGWRRGGRQARRAGGRESGDARCRRYVAAAEPARLDGPRVGRLLGGIRRGARRDRPLHVSQRAQRAAAAVQGRFPERVRPGRRRAVEREIRHLDRAHRRRERRAARQRLLRVVHHLHAPGLHAELPLGRKQVQVPVPRQRLPHRPA